MRCSICCFVAFWAAGCTSEVVVPQASQNGQNAQEDEGLFDQAIENLNQLADFGPDEILDQIRDRLNQWSRSSHVEVAWQPDKLIASLPLGLRESTLLAGLGSNEYSLSDARFLRQAVLMRDTARFACKDTYDNKLDKARRLFEWTVNNIVLDSDPGPRQPLVAQMPWQTLVFGHGRSIDRAWVFMQLARQEGLEVVLLAIPMEDKPELANVWCTAFVDEDGQLFLFDQTYGLPIPGKNGEAVATLEQAATDESVLKQLDTAGQPYPVRSENLKHVDVLIDAGSQCLSRRMKTIQSKLTGQYSTVLTSQPSAVAERLANSARIEKTRIWLWPFEAERLLQVENSPSQISLRQHMHIFELALMESKPVLFSQQRSVRQKLVYPLWSGRLKHLAGDLGPSRGDAALDEAATGPSSKAEVGNDEEGHAQALYLQARTIMTQIMGANLPEEIKRQLENLKGPANLNKWWATYWLGLIKLEQGDYDLAQTYFQQTLSDNRPSWWTQGARFNLARAYELDDQPEKAAEQYRLVTFPAKLGSLVRAQSLATEAPAGDSDQGTDSVPDDDQPPSPATNDVKDLPAKDGATEPKKAVEAPTPSK